jgi:tetratricopeptide (TPR) repeat protein
MGSRGSIFCAAMMLAGAMALASPAWSQSYESEFPTQAQKSDLQLRFGRALVDQGRDLVLNPGAGVDDVRRTLLRRAAIYEDVQEFAQAEAELTEALQMTPPIGDTYAARGYFYMRRGRYAGALADFLAGIQLAPDDARLRFAAGRAQLALGEHAAAVAFYSDAIRLAPHDPTLYLARAEARIHLDQPADARADYDRALAIKLPAPSDRYFAFLGRGYSFLMQADYAGAIADFGRAIELDPASLNALLWRGYAREKTGQVALALDDYERAVAIAPKDRMARDNVQRLRSN